MKISRVPAQITTVEDKLVGNFSMQQAVLLGMPIVIGFIAVIILPPFNDVVLYKKVIIGISVVACCLLAVRVKGRIVAGWMRLFMIYAARPHYYVYDKNSSYLRETNVPEPDCEGPVISTAKQARYTPAISPREFIRLKQFATGTQAGMKFRVGRKGELNVHVTETK